MVFRRLLVLAAAVLQALPLGAAGRATSSRPVSPTVALGGVLNASLPSLSELEPGTRLPELGPAPDLSGIPSIPAAHDAEKARGILQRAESMDRDRVLGHEGPVLEPRHLLETVNAVLKDLGPEQLRSLDEERLHGISGLLLDKLSGRPDPYEGILALSQASLDRVLGMRGKGVRETLINPGHPEMHEDMVEAEGVPDGVRLMGPRKTPGGEGVLRHYTTKEGLEAILGSNRIWNGFLSYVDLAKGLHRRTFDDLKGVFFTLPGVGGYAVGVPAQGFPHFVDVRLPGELPLLEIETDRIFLVPLPGRPRDWVKEMYFSWISGGDVRDHNHEWLRGMDARGGPGPELSLPVKVVRHGRAR